VHARVLRCASRSSAAPSDAWVGARVSGVPRCETPLRHVRPGYQACTLTSDQDKPGRSARTWAGRRVGAQLPCSVRGAPRARRSGGSDGPRGPYLLCRPSEALWGRAIWSFFASAGGKFGVSRAVDLPDLKRAAETTRTSPGCGVARPARRGPLSPRRRRGPQQPGSVVRAVTRCQGGRVASPVC